MVFINARDIDRMARKLSGQSGYGHPIAYAHNWAMDLTNRANQWGGGLGDLGLGGIFRGIKRGIKPAINEAKGIAKDVGTKLAENVVQDLIAGKSLKTSVQDRGKQSRDIALQSALERTLQRQKGRNVKKPSPAPKRKREPSKSKPAKKQKKEPKVQKDGQIGGWYSYQHDLKHGNLKEYKKHTKKRKTPRKQSGGGKQTGGGKKRVKKQSGSGKKRGKRVKKQSGSGKKRGKREPKDIFTSSKKQRGGSQRSVWYGNRTTPPWWY